MRNMARPSINLCRVGLEDNDVLQNEREVLAPKSFTSWPKKPQSAGLGLGSRATWAMGFLLL